MRLGYTAHELAWIRCTHKFHDLRYMSNSLRITLSIWWCCENYSVNHVASKWMHTYVLHLNFIILALWSFYINSFYVINFIIMSFPHSQEVCRRSYIIHRLHVYTLCMHVESLHGGLMYTWEYFKRIIIV